MQQQIVTLPNPIPVNGEKLTKVTLTMQPTGRMMGQYTAFDLMEGNVKALAYVLPKITQPPLSNNMIKDTTIDNQLALVAGFNRFFDGLEPDGLVETVDTTTSKPKKPTD